MLVPMSALTKSEDCDLLIRLAERQTTKKMRDSLLAQAHEYATRTAAPNSWLMIADPSDPADGEFSAWLIATRVCAACGMGYEVGNGLLLILPSITIHAACLAAKLPKTKEEIDEELRTLATHFRSRRKAS